MLAVAKGVRLPGLWAATQLQIDYSFGPVKRGAAGATLRFLHLPIEHYWVFAAFSLCVFALTAALLVAFIRRRYASREIALLTALFASSFAVTYLVHLIGFLDIILLAMTLCVLLLPQSRYLPFLALCVCLSGVLVHEIFLLCFFPVLWFRFFLDAMLTSGAARRRAIVWALLLPAAVVAETIALAAARPMGTEELAAFQAALGAKADFPLRSDVLDVMGRTASENFTMVMERAKLPRWWVREAGGILSLFWMAVFFSWQSARLIARSTVRNKPLTIIVAVGVSLAPALTQIIAWDLYRWYAICVFAAFIALLMLVERLAADVQGEWLVSRSKTVVFILMAFSLTAGAGFFEKYKVNTFPYADNLLEAKETYDRFGYIPAPVR
jgi:hypothetical protein